MKVLVTSATVIERERERGRPRNQYLHRKQIPRSSNLDDRFMYIIHQPPSVQLYRNSRCIEGLAQVRSAYVTFRSACILMDQYLDSHTLRIMSTALSPTSSTSKSLKLSPMPCSPVIVPSSSIDFRWMRVMISLPATSWLLGQTMIAW